MPKPGVMIYFDIKHCLKRLNDTQKAVLFEAILEYGEYGAFDESRMDETALVAWDLIKPRIDSDNEAYQLRCTKAREAVNTRWEKEKNTEVYGCIRQNTNNTKSNQLKSNQTNGTQHNHFTESDLNEIMIQRRKANLL